MQHAQMLRVIAACIIEWPASTVYHYEQAYCLPYLYLLHAESVQQQAADARLVASWPMEAVCPAYLHRCPCDRVVPLTVAH